MKSKSVVLNMTSLGPDLRYHSGYKTEQRAWHCSLSELNAPTSLCPVRTSSPGAARTLLIGAVHKGVGQTTLRTSLQVMASLPVRKLRYLQTTSQRHFNFLEQLYVHLSLSLLKIVFVLFWQHLSPFLFFFFPLNRKQVGWDKRHKDNYTVLLLKTTLVSLQVTWFSLFCL